MDTIKDAVEQIDVDRGPDSSGKSIEHDDSEKNFGHADHKDHHDANVEGISRDLNTDRDLDRGIAENHDLNRVMRSF